MWQSYLNGILVAAGLIIAIGAQNAFVLAQSLRREHHLSVAALCVFCDAVLVSLGVFGLAKLLLENPTLLAIARWGGIAFLTWYGLKALLRALRPDALGNAAETGPRSRKAVLLAALAVTLLNPHVYLDTVLLIGSLGAQQAAPGAYALGAPTVAAWICPDTGAMIRSSRHWEPRLRVAPGALSGALRRTSPRGSRTGSRTGIGPAP